MKVFPTGRTDPNHNPFEAVARARKVGRLRAKIDGMLRAQGLDPWHPAVARRMVAILTGPHTQHDRDGFADAAGVKSPSPDTWADLVAVYRDRL